ncbi:MAG: hypothetical protein A2315_08480 [Ignavibacteria bacterium RIFOXYB2_FULL_35_12]|nr:MAG: hypothetical protein A2058_04495 [Ignavibacteria bacterium GWA2_36_19]OGU54893.1 MAG: hypothetical protein A2006_13905 [Ignavibacteria bacterium GWC2_35_8]OGU59777.1 MAG: hypothetical protein A2X60_10480 [Ignavibacteria bacterium GWF2_35_20]OGU78752.1 MAG: hypothetical protein A2254_00460 [Ignavibacteria bacterium RIFOXYA2_FULL_35_9]OGU85245.1 MAG: hypothetical protein A3K31_11940 [Ignavibacteria bacterium RIFOXYA12_FULL_35_25]OGU91745.1 MAG: hypothetical protein A2492_07170 [Ignavibac
MVFKKYFLITLCLKAIIITGCGSSQLVDNQKNVTREYFYYYYDAEDVVNESPENPLTLSKLRLNLSDASKIEEVMDSITNRLTIHFQKSYVYADIKGIKNIKIGLIKFDMIKTEQRNFIIATIDIDDPEEVCMSYHFQGSAGGMQTYNRLGANLLQPSYEYPFIDGVIILYKGLPMQPLDHINLNGILVPRFFEDVGYRAKLRDNN